jgi:hypothetical protein
MLEVADLRRCMNLSVMERQAVPVAVVETEEELSRPGDGGLGGPGEITDAGA